MAKLYFIAALAALPAAVAAVDPSTVPHPAPDAARPAASALPLALDYLNREMEARLQAPAQGKAPRPDLPSKLTFSQAHRDAVRALFGTEQPLQIQRIPGPGPAAAYRLTIPAHQYQQDTTRIAWQAVSGKLSIDRQGRIATMGTWPGLEASGSEGSYALQGARVTSLRQRDLLTGKSLVELDQLSLKAADGVAATLRNLKADTSITREGKLLTMRMDLGVRQLAAGGENIDNLHLGLHMRRLDQDTLLAMRAIVEAVRDNGSARDNLQPTAAELRRLFERLVLRGAAFDIDDLSAVFRGHQASLKLSLSMPGAAPADFTSAERVMQKLAAKVQVRIPLPMLRDLAGMVAERSNRGKDQPEVPTAQLAGQMHDVFLGKAVGGNFAKVENNALVTTIELKGGNLFVNAQAIPVEPLLAWLNGPDTRLPPPDTSKPAAVHMQDRGLEAVRLFALNGNLEGLYAMCERHLFGIGVEQDHQQALKWCAKGNQSGAYGNQVLLARLYLDGDDSVRDHAAAVKLLLPLAEVRHNGPAQYQLFRIYHEGLGVDKDERKALGYLRQAADDGDDDALDVMRRIDSTYQAPPGDDNSDPWTINADVPGGHYQSRNYRFDTTRHRHLRMTLGPFKDDEKWAPMQALCYSALHPSDVVCLRMVREYHGAADFTVYSEVMSTDGATHRNRLTLPAKFKEGDTIDVRAYVRAGHAYFLVNDQQPMVQPIDFPVELMNLFCSTGRCRFAFERPPQ